jgi:2-polyprenyl-6-methoxyphenol hydroxylase-like FAD-dependent oxidoreductase
MDTDVLIVGAGPVGLFLANECARRGVRFRLVEAHATQSVHSKALAIFPRTLEILDMAGLVGPFLERANPVTAVAVVSHGRRLAHLRFAPNESPYPLIAMVPQSVTERLLAEALALRGGAVEYDTTLVSVVDHGERVSAILERGGQCSEVSAAFAVGCDGAHSTVRHLLSLPFEGGEYADSFMLADIETNDALPANELQLCPSQFGPVAIFPMSATRRRIVATVDRPEGEAPTLELVRQILRQRAPAALEAHEVHWSSYFRIHHRHASRLRVGRCFIAGDAAHIHSPYGGQGMNTGLHDAWNLVWKLDLFLKGLGNDRLLESYSAERVPVIEHVIETTDILTRVMSTPHRWVQLLRDTMIPMVSSLAPFQHAFVERLSELGIAYGGSAIVEGAGERYFDESLRGGDGIRGRFLLFCDNEAAAPLRDATRTLAESLRDLLELRETPRPGIALVRPDGYVAYAAPRRAGVAAVGGVVAVLERQTKTGGSRSLEQMASEV